MAAAYTLPVTHCIGNHDVWGIPEAKDDPRYAKQWAVEKLGIPARYYDYEQNGWHFIVLDSTHLKEDGTWYTAVWMRNSSPGYSSAFGKSPQNVPFLFSRTFRLYVLLHFLMETMKQPVTGRYRVPGCISMPAGL